MELITLNRVSYRKTQNKTENYRKALLDPSFVLALQHAPPARRRHSTIETLDWVKPPSGREVDGPRFLGTSILHHERRRLGQRHQLHRDLEQPEPPSHGLRHGGHAQHASDETRARQGRQIRRWTPPEHQPQRREPPPANATPATPPPPQRCRLATYCYLRYVHAEIRRFPILPSPERLPEGEESNGSAAARWEQEGCHKSPSFTVDGRKETVQARHTYVLFDNAN